MKEQLSLLLGRSVSRETLASFDAYLSLLGKWNDKINLVSGSTLQETTTRHFLDSAQIANVAPLTGSWADFGSGAGFPGLVLALIGQGSHPFFEMTLVESDQRKCAFLREVIRAASIHANLMNTRIEELSGPGFDVVTARALAPLPKLLDLSAPRLKPGGICVFLKGANARKEIQDAQRTWSFDLELHASRTQTDAHILVLRKLVRV